MSIGVPVTPSKLVLRIGIPERSPTNKSALRAGNAAFTAAGTSVAVAGQVSAPVLLSPLWMATTAARTLPKSTAASPNPAGPAVYPKPLIVGSKNILKSQTASVPYPPLLPVTLSRLLNAITGSAASINFGLVSARRCVMVPPSEAPHATVRLICGNFFLTIPNNSTFVLTADSAFQPGTANPEPASA